MRQGWSASRWVAKRKADDDPVLAYGTATVPQSLVRLLLGSELTGGCGRPFFRACGGFDRLWDEGAGQPALAPGGIGQQPVVADFHEAVWKDVQEKAADEFRRTQCHGPLASGSEGDVVSVVVGQTAIGQPDPVRVPAEIPVDVVCAGERALAVDHPSAGEQSIDKGLMSRARNKLWAAMSFPGD